MPSFGSSDSASLGMLWMQHRVDLAVVEAGARQMQRFVTHRLGNRVPIAAVSTHVDDARVAVAHVADRRHAQLTADAAPRGW